MPHSGKFVAILNKGYGNMLGSQECVWTTQKLFPSSTDPNKEVVACRKNFIISKL